MTQRTLPNLIIAGVNKAGTTSLFMYLKAHPEISASTVKETCYFLPIRYGGEQPPVDEYRRFFEPAATPYLMEGTPGYFYGGRPLAEAIRRTTPDAQIVIVLREPISRLLSFYKFMKSRQQIDKKIKLADYVALCESCPPGERPLQKNNHLWGIEGGFYDQYLPAWVDVFGKNLKIILFDDLMKSPSACMQDLCAWLELDGSLYTNLQLETENRSVGYRSGFVQKIALTLNSGAELFWRRYPALKQSLRSLYYQLNGQEFEESIAPETRAYLDDLFREHNARLAEQLTALGHTSLPKWLK